MKNPVLIKDIVSQSADAQTLSEVFSDHFDHIAHPVSVSLGLVLKDKNIKDIVDILRSSGINAIPFYNSKVKDDMSCFVVDGSGVRSPLLSPEDAIKATADLFEIMHQHGIETSRALPVSRESMIPAVSEAYCNKLIDIAANNPSEKNLNEFLSSQLEHALQMPSAELKNNGSLYRGGTLGDTPYAITPHQRKRDGAYASNDVNTALEYADGKKGNGFSFPEIDVKGHGKTAYGFLYEFAECDGQRFYGMAEIENPHGSEECKGKAENRPDYETLIVPDRNPLKAVYLKVDDKIVQIADEKGYFSRDWERFAHIHTPYNTNEKNDFMVERTNRQFADFPVMKYERKNVPLEKDVTEVSFEGVIFGKDIVKNQDGSYVINNANLSSMVPKSMGKTQFTGDFNLNNCVIPSETDKLDLSRCSGFVGISDSDLSSVKNITAPASCNVFFLENVKLAEGTALDLSHLKCKRIVFRNQDLSKLKELKLPEGVDIQYKGNTTLPEKTSAGISKAALKLAEMRSRLVQHPSGNADLPRSEKAPYRPQKEVSGFQSLYLYQKKIQNTD